MSENKLRQDTGLTVLSVELAQTVPLLLPLVQVNLVQTEGGRAQEHVLLELTVVPDSRLQSLTDDHVPGDPVLQHLHEAGVAVLPHHLGLPLGLLGGVRVEIDFHIRIRFLLQSELVISQFRFIFFSRLPSLSPRSSSSQCDEPEHRECPPCRRRIA